MKIPFRLLLLSIVFTSSAAFAEIEEVTLRWTAGLCTASCGKGLEAQLRKIQGVSDVSVNVANAQAVLKWKPNVTFTYPPIDTAMRLIGLELNQLKVKVSGTITHDAHNVRLISSGDRTSFDLINPVIPVKNQYVERNSILNRGLTPELRQSLIDAQAQGEIATITGTIFEPERSPPLNLVVEHSSFAKPKK